MRAFLESLDILVDIFIYMLIIGLFLLPLSVALYLGVWEYVLIYIPLIGGIKLIVKYLLKKENEKENTEKN